MFWEDKQKHMSSAAITMPGSHLYWIGRLEWSSGKCKCLLCSLQLLWGTIRFVKMFPTLCFLSKHFLWRSQGCVFFSCLFSLSTNDNIIITCKVVVLRDFLHVCYFLLINFFFLWLNFFRYVLIVCIALVQTLQFTKLLLLQGMDTVTFAFIFWELVCSLFDTMKCQGFLFRKNLAAWILVAWTPTERDFYLWQISALLWKSGAVTPVQAAQRRMVLYVLGIGLLLSKIFMEIFWTYKQKRWPEDTEK